MRRVSMISLLLLLSASLFGCQSKQKSAASWTDDMHALSQSLLDLAPYLYSSTNFSSPNNHEKIKSSLLRFSNIAHTNFPEKHFTMVYSDPSFKYVVRDLNQNLDHVLIGFQSGNKECARRVMKAVMNRCIFCHTQNRFAPKLSLKRLDGNHFPGLNSLEKADLLVAFNNYDKALIVLDGFLKSKSAVQSVHFDQAIRRYLA